MTTVTALKKRVAERLSSFGIEPDETRREAEIIVEHVTGLSLTEQVKAGPQSVASDNAQRDADAILERRQRREPLQYILGHTVFRGLKFQCRAGVFIPRDDTETVVEAALQLLPGKRAGEELRVVEIGPGAGTICIAMLHAREDLNITALEVSDTAARLTKDNAAFNGVESRLQVIPGDWLAYAGAGGFAMIVTNPPYIPRSQQSCLQPEVGLWEPEEALFGADGDGLATYRAIAARGARLLRAGGWVVAEVGDGRCAEVMDIFETCGWGAIASHLDVNGLKRAISAQAPNIPVQAG